MSKVGAPEAVACCSLSSSFSVSSSSDLISSFTKAEHASNAMRTADEALTAFLGRFANESDCKGDPRRLLDEPHVGVGDDKRCMVNVDELD